MGDLETLAAAQQRLIEKRLALGIGSKTDHARRAVQRGGRRVRCMDCGHEEKIKTWAGRRLRQIGCPECSGRMHPLNWGGWQKT